MTCNCKDSRIKCANDILGRFYLTYFFAKKRPFAKKSDEKNTSKFLAKGLVSSVEFSSEALEPDFVLQNRLLILRFVNYSPFGR